MTILKLKRLLKEPPSEKDAWLSGAVAMKSYPNCFTLPIGESCLGGGDFRLRALYAERHRSHRQIDFVEYKRNFRAGHGLSSVMHSLRAANALKYYYSLPHSELLRGTEIPQYSCSCSPGFICPR